VSTLTDTIRHMQAEDRARMAALEMLGLAKASRDSADSAEAASEYQRHVAFAEQRLRQLSATRFEPLADAEFEPDNRGNLFAVLMLALILAGTVGATIWRMM
jgi:hypothetical protein